MNVQAAVTAYQNDAGLAAAANERMAQLLSRSATDATFRAKLLSEPRAAIAEFNGVDVSAISESFNVAFIENKGDATIVLPDFIDSAAELSADELEAVAGGVTPTIVAVTAVGLVLYAAYNDGASDGRGHCR